MAEAVAVKPKSKKKGKTKKNPPISIHQEPETADSSNAAKQAGLSQQVTDTLQQDGGMGSGCEQVTKNEENGDNSEISDLPKPDADAIGLAREREASEKNGVHSTEEDEKPSGTRPQCQASGSAVTIQEAALQPASGDVTQDETCTSVGNDGLVTPALPSTTAEEHAASQSASTESLVKQSELAESSEQLSTRVQEPGEAELAPLEAAAEQVLTQAQEPVEAVVIPTDPPPSDGMQQQQLTAAKSEAHDSGMGYSQLYPDLQIHTQPLPAADLQPFTQQQLLSLYFNPQLQQNSEYIERFLQEAHQDKHEFYEIVLNYYRARNHLAGAEHDISVLRQDYEKLQDLVWEAQEEKITVQGHCQDKAKVSIEHTYFKVCFNESAHQDVTKVLKQVRSHIQNDLSLYAYEAQLSRLQVESYLHQLYVQNPALHDLPPNAPVTAMLARERPPQASHQVEALRTAITILFMFQRKPAKDDVFVKDTRLWLTRLVGTLLRIATIEDHVYLLNQLLRCPAGVGKWAASFLQVLPLPCAVGQSTWGGPVLDHIVTLLATLLIPARGREDLLSQMRVTLNFSNESPNENHWILVDSDGEEDEDPANSWLYLQENDVVALLGQVPLDAIFRHVLFIDTWPSSDEDRYNVEHTSEACMLKLFAFASCLISILGQGLQTYSIGRYRQLNKRLGRMVRHIIQYVADHWVNFKSVLQPMLSELTVQRLQLEFDFVFLRASLCILSAQRLGSWQFLTDLPYSSLSASMMWRLVWTMHSGCQDTSKVRLQISMEECKKQLLDADNKMWFEDTLTGLPTSEAMYLLTTFANMACCRPSGETDFIEAIAAEIFEIAYMCTHTREFCSKPGREMLASIAVKHPFVISCLLMRVKASMKKIGMVSVYLFKGLPLLTWKPTDEDMQCVRDWLLHTSLSSPKNQLARVITEKMNWGFNDQQADELFLDLSRHRWMAVLVVEAYTKHLAGKTVGSLFTEGLRQMASLVRSQQSEEQQLASWAWETILHLKLHANMQPQPVMGSPTEHFANIPDLKDDPVLHPVLKASKDSYAIASYVVLAMTSTGHGIKDFCSEGVTQLRLLLEKCHVIPAIKALSCIMPTFYRHVDYLSSNNGFMSALQYLLAGDQSKKGLIFSDFPGPATKLLSAMIQMQVQTASIPGGVGGCAVVQFWLVLFSHVPRWFQDRNILYVVDKMLKVAFRIPASSELVSTFFTEEFQKLLQAPEKEQGMLSSLVTWLSSGNSQPSFIDANSCAEFSWFAFAVLDAEAKYEEAIGLWGLVQQKVYGESGTSLEPAVKKAAAELKLGCSPSGHRLAIYRWANQAMDMDVAHPLLPLVWQRFFLLYLGRSVPEAGLPSRGSMGEKFFTSPADISLLKRMKKRLSKAAEHYHREVTETEGKLRAQRRSSRCASAGNSGLSSEEEAMSSEDEINLLDSDSQSQVQFFGTLIRFYHTLSFWLDEPRLHDAALYLPALPPQYDAERLLSIFQCNKEPWLEFINFEKIDLELAKLAKEWTEQVSHDSCHDNLGHESTPDQQNTATDRILRRLKLDGKPVAPPCLVPLRAPVPEISRALLCDKQNLIFALGADYSVLVEHAKLFHLRTAHHVGLDCTFLELLPDWFSNEMTETVLNMPCRSTFNPTHKCKGPAVVTCRYEEKKRNDIVNRKIDENRAEYKQLMIELLLPPPQAVCGAAVHVENALTNLIKLHKMTTSPSEKDLAMEVGTTLFYHLSAYVSEHTKIYPPTRQFFSSCIEILGQEFIRNNPTQSQPLLQAILQTPSLVGLLAPNFSPNASPELFVDMYEDMLKVPFNQGSDVAFSLLSKFDVQMWLENANPPLSQRSALLDLLTTALTDCGKEPEAEVRLVFEVYRAHVQHLFIYKFPDHYGAVLRLILTASATEQLSPVIWNDFLDSLGCVDTSQPPPTPASPEKPESPATNHLPPPYTRRPRELSTSHMKETMEWMSSYFFRLRVSSTDAASFGLYPKWKLYIQPLSQFHGFLAERAVVAMEKSVKCGTKEAEAGVKEVWQLIVDLFAPWIQPLDNNGQILSPWILSDVELANQMVKQFVNGIRLLQLMFESHLPVCSQNALSLLWPYHIRQIVKKDSPKHVQRAFHNQLTSLPWNKFYPDIQAMDLMVKVYEAQGKECFRFLAHIVCHMPWSLIVENYCKHEVLDIVSHMHMCLFTLLVQLGQNEEALKTLPLMPLLSQAEGFNWNMLDGASYANAAQWLVEHCDPKCVVAEHTAVSAQVLNLLKKAALFYHLDSGNFSHPETPVKRVAYVRCIVQLLSKCSHLDVRGDAMGSAISNLLTQVETVVSSMLDIGQQRQESLSLCMEVISIMNHCNPQGRSSAAVLSSLLAWVGDSSSSVLLLPVITAACRSLASITHLVKLVEGSMDAYFLGDVCSNDSAGWGPLLSVLQIPELSHDQFLEEGVAQGCYLMLHAYILQRLPLSQSLADELSQLNMLIAWNSKAKPTRNNEAKLLLWWGKILELILRQIDYGGDHKQLTRTLHNLIPALVTLGEDKSSAGLLGAIGLGKKSQLSRRFRLLAKCLSTYLAAQVPADNSLRTQPQAPGFVTPPGKSSTPRSPSGASPATQAIQALNQLDSLKNNKQYAEHKEHIEYVVEFVCNANHCLRDALRFFVELSTAVFPDKNCLAILRYVSNPYHGQTGLQASS